MKREEIEKISMDILGGALLRYFNGMRYICIWQDIKQVVI